MTSYTYAVRGELSTLTAPGPKTWTYTYNDLGQPVNVVIPNGMDTVYTNDPRNRRAECTSEIQTRSVR